MGGRWDGTLRGRCRAVFIFHKYGSQGGRTSLKICLNREARRLVRLEASAHSHSGREQLETERWQARISEWLDRAPAILDQARRNGAMPSCLQFNTLIFINKAVAIIAAIIDTCSLW